MLARNFQVAIRIPVVRQINDDIAKDDKRRIKLDRNIDFGEFRPYVRENSRFCLN